MTVVEGLSEERRADARLAELRGWFRLPAPGGTALVPPDWRLGDPLTELPCCEDPTTALEIWSDLTARGWQLRVVQIAPGEWAGRIMSKERDRNVTAPTFGQAVRNAAVWALEPVPDPAPAAEAGHGR